MVAVSVKRSTLNVPDDPDVCLDCLDLIFVTFKQPASRLRAYCDCNPIRAFETFDVSKEPICKTARSWMFWYKRGCNWLGAFQLVALWSRGFSRGLLKPLAPRVSEAWGTFHYTGPADQRPLGLTKGKWNTSEPKVRPN